MPFRALTFINDSFLTFSFFSLLSFINLNDLPSILLLTSIGFHIYILWSPNSCEFHPSCAVDQTPNSPPPFLPGTSISSFGGFCLRYGSYCAQIYFHMNTRRENAFPSNNKQVEGVVLVSGNNSSNICEYGKKKKSNNNNSNSNIIVPAGCSSRSSRPWSILKDPRIVRVSRSLGGKDRHSKVRTIRGLRDRRVRLSVQTAIQLYDLQDRLGLNQPSKVVDWLLAAAQQDIDNLPPLPLMPLDNFMMHYAAASASAPAHHHHLHHHQVLPTVVDSSPTSNTTTSTTTLPFQFAAASNINGSPHYPLIADPSRENIHHDHQAKYSSNNKENALLLMGHTSTSTSTNIDLYQKNSWVRRINSSIGEQGEEQQQQHPQLQHSSGQQGLVPYASYYHWDASAANPCVGGVGHPSFTQAPAAGTDQELVLPHIAISSSSIPAGPHQLLLCPSFFPSYADLYDPKYINHFQMINPPASHNPLPASHSHANRSRPAP